ncbi:MAG: type II toxin-antitoxin system VapB family antitoxin [Candidatus Saccharibacteria bacterium]|nr:type II toxin-antitoxin system VapB family antitoxin [Candidatus Saccharibacteria bacterium]
MRKAKIFQNGRSQAVRLPKEFSFKDNTKEVYIDKIGDVITLRTKKPDWDDFLEALDTFPKDGFKGDWRKQGIKKEDHRDWSVFE